MLRFLLLLGLCLGLGAPVWAQSEEPERESDSTAQAASADWLLLPFASYSPDTKLAGGLVVGYYLPAPAEQSPSSVQVTLTGTQRRQLIAEIEPELYVQGDRVRLQGELRGSKYPNSFYGIGGDTPDSLEESFTARYVHLDVTVQQRIWTDLRIGPRVFGRIGSVSETDEGGTIGPGRVPGAEGGTTLGVGVSTLWDARDSRYYPTTGTYFETDVLWYSAVWGSDYTFGRWRGDLRAYDRLGPGVLAGQFYTEAVLGTAPFQLLPLLGGSSRMRGYREGRFRHNVYWTTQLEYRFPIFWRFKGTTFASAGEVGPRVGSALFNRVEMAVGIGGRVQFTDDGVHGRLDVAFSRTGTELYISLGEAF